MPVAARVEENIELPQNVEVQVKGDKVEVKGTLGELSRSFPSPKIDIERKKNTLVLRCMMPRRGDKALLGTYLGHLKNMLKGVTSGFTYELHVIYSHFPIKTYVRGSELVVENFLGENKPRKCKLVEGVKVEVKGDRILVKGIEKEKVAQIAANIERVTRIKGFDPRVFQDGIYLVGER